MKVSQYNQPTLASFFSIRNKLCTVIRFVNFILWLDYQVDGQEFYEYSKVSANGVPLFTIDSKNVDAFVPNRTSMTGRSVRDNIANTSDLYNNNFSILRTALEIFGKK